MQTHRLDLVFSGFSSNHSVQLSAVNPSTMTFGIGSELRVGQAANLAIKPGSITLRPTDLERDVT